MKKKSLVRVTTKRPPQRAMNKRIRQANKTLKKLIKK